MKRTAVALSLFVVAACASAPPPRRPETMTAPVAQPVHAANALTPVAAVAKTIAEPRIRVGIVNDQAAVTFPRIAGGYYIAGDGGAAVIPRGFTMTPPVPDAPAHYAVQVSTVSD